MLTSQDYNLGICRLMRMMETNEDKLALGLKISFSIFLIHVDFASKLAAYCNWLTGILMSWSN